MGNTLILTVASGKAFLLALLASIDFAIVPEASIDPLTLSITNYRNTSGPYYIATKQTGCRLTLAANPNHYHWRPDIPQQVDLIPTRDLRDSVNKFKLGEVDMLSTVDHASIDDVINISRSVSDTHLHITKNIRSLVATFTNSGVLKFTSAERLTLAKLIRRAIQDCIHHRENFQNAVQIFPAFGEAGLDQNRIDMLDEMFGGPSEEQSSSLPVRVRLIRLQFASEIRAALLRVLPNVKIEFGSVPSYAVEPEHPDLFISGPDLNIREDVSLLSYYLGAGYFKIRNSEWTDWLKVYQGKINKADRLDLLKTLHFETIAALYTVPIAFYPYAAVTKSPWTIHLSNLFANNQLWLVRLT